MRQNRVVVRSEINDENRMNKRPSSDSPSFRRVRRPTDLLLGMAGVIAVLAMLELIHTLPLGSAELSGDVSQWLRHIPRWLSFAAVVVAAMGAVSLVAVAII